MTERLAPESAAQAPQTSLVDTKDVQKPRELPRKPVGPVVYTETSGVPLFPDILSWWRRLRA